MSSPDEATSSWPRDRDTIRVLVRPEDDLPRRGVPVAPGGDVHGSGAWPAPRLEGARLGPHENGSRA